MSKENKKVSLKKMIYTGGYLRNPVLVQVIGICPVAAAATSLFNSFVLAAVFTVTLILCEVLANLALKKVPGWIRAGIYIILGTAVVFPVMFFAEQKEYAGFANLGIYLPLMAMNSFACVHCEKYAVKHTVKEAFFDGVASSAGYSAVIVLVGAIREIAGTGKIAGYIIFHTRGINAAVMPFGGLFVIGLLAALHKSSVMKKYGKNAKGIEKRFVLDESAYEEGTFSYAVKKRFSKKKI